MTRHSGENPIPDHLQGKTREDRARENWKALKILLSTAACGLVTNNKGKIFNGNQIARRSGQLRILEKKYPHFRK